MPRKTKKILLRTESENPAGVIPAYKTMDSNQDGLLKLHLEAHSKNMEKLRRRTIQPNKTLYKISDTGMKDQ